MRSFALPALLVSVTLVACVSAGSDDESTEQDIVAAHLDGGSAAADASASDGGVAVDGGPVVGADGGAASDVPTYAEVGPIIHATCDGCHHNAFNSLAKVKANKSRMLQMVSSGRMPRNNPGWKNTEDGQAVLDFLANSPELE